MEHIIKKEATMFIVASFLVRPAWALRLDREEDISIASVLMFITNNVLF